MKITLKDMNEKERLDMLYKTFSRAYTLAKDKNDPNWKFWKARADRYFKMLEFYEAVSDIGGTVTASQGFPHVEVEYTR